jgi:putative peptide zinc metalloprotease protein
MAESLFSPYWYRVAQLHPRLVSTAEVHRQCFRGEQWYVLNSSTGGRQFRVNALAYQFVGRLDGRQSVQQIWDSLVQQMGDEAPSQNEVLSILSALNGAGMIHSESSSDLSGIFDAAERRRKASNQLNPLALRVPLFDPTPLLDTLAPLSRALFKPAMLLLWLIGVCACLVLCAMHWPALSSYASLHAMSTRNLLLVWLLYPLLKLIHELAHACAIRHWQGEVREVGATLFLLIPVPYVDASAASCFADKRHRILVSAMGVIAESSIAGLALLLWLTVSDGWLRDIAFACMLIGGVSTVLVNANPLMRYDGYYVLTDWLELPGLATRADAWLRYLGERWILGNRDLPAPAGSERQRWLLGLYGCAALVYRTLLYAGAFTWLLGKQLLLGAALGLWLVWRYILRPLWRSAQLVLSAPRLEAHRLRALSGFALTLGALLCLLCAVPMPSSRQAEGVVWVPDEAQLRIDTEGFVEEVLAQDDSMVSAGAPILRLSNQELRTEREQLAAQQASIEFALNAALMQQPGLAVALHEELDKLEQRAAELDERLDKLLIRSPAAGRLALPRAQDLAGRFLPRGSTVAQVVPPSGLIVRTVLSQVDVDQLRDALSRVEVRLAEDRSHSLSAQIGQDTPAASYQLPSVVLGDRAGGSILTDPADQEGLRALESFFVLDLQIPDAPLQRIGSRAWVRFERSPETLAVQWSRRLHQLFVKQLSAGPGDLPAPL